MIIVLKPNISEQQIAEVVELATKHGYEPKLIRGVERTILACVGDERTHSTLETFINLPAVESVTPIQKKYKLVSRDFKPKDTTFKIHGVEVGSPHFQVIAGPCSVEGYEQAKTTATRVKELGANFFRAGAFKPRTSPYDFQGLGKEGLKILRQIHDETKLPIVTEVVSPAEAELVAEFSDVLQIGTRNAQNYPLLIAAAQTGKPILLKRGFASTVTEWLLAAEYVASHGNEKIILCERGIRTFETSTRNTLDLSAVAVAKSETHLPIFVDPSHAAGRSDMVLPLAKASIAAGADGLLIEVHPNPSEAWSDDAQQLSFDQFANFMQEIKPFLKAAGRQ